jgi:hypothetical protein
MAGAPCWPCPIAVCPIAVCVPQGFARAQCAPEVLWPGGACWLLVVLLRHAARPLAEHDGVRTDLVEPD